MSVLTNSDLSVGFGYLQDQEIKARVTAKNLVDYGNVGPLSTGGTVLA
jgi:hypothetical protein